MFPTVNTGGCLNISCNVPWVCVVGEPSSRDEKKSRSKMHQRTRVNCSGEGHISRACGAFRIPESSIVIQIEQFSMWSLHVKFIVVCFLCRLCSTFFLVDPPLTEEPISQLLSVFSLYVPVGLYILYTFYFRHTLFLS